MRNILLVIIFWIPLRFSRLKAQARNDDVLVFPVIARWLLSVVEINEAIQSLHPVILIVVKYRLRANLPKEFLLLICRLNQSIHVRVLPSYV